MIRYEYKISKCLLAQCIAQTCRNGQFCLDVEGETEVIRKSKELKYPPLGRVLGEPVLLACASICMASCGFGNAGYSTETEIRGRETLN